MPNNIPNNFLDSHALNTSSLVNLKNYKGEQYCKDVISVMIGRILVHFGKRSDITDEMIPSLVSEIMNRYPTFTISDLKMIFTKMKEQPINKFNLDYATVIGTLYQAKQDKMAAFEFHNQNEHSRLVGGEKGYREKSKDPKMHEARLKDLVSQSKK